jgi:transposase
MMFPATDYPTSCEIRALTRLLHTVLPESIMNYAPRFTDKNVMSEGTVRQWCEMFKDRKTNVHDEKRSGRPSVASDDLVQNVDQKMYERRSFTIS